VPSVCAPEGGLDRYLSVGTSVSRPPLDRSVSGKPSSYDTCLQLWEATQRLVRPHLASPGVLSFPQTSQVARKSVLLYTICQTSGLRGSYGRGDELGVGLRTLRPEVDSVVPEEVWPVHTRRVPVGEHGVRVARHSLGQHGVV